MPSNRYSADAVFNFIGKDKGLSKTAKGAAKEVDTAKKSISGSTVAMGVALAGVGAVVTKSISTYQNYGKEIKNVQRLTGATAEQASTLVGQMKMIGGEQVNVGESLRRWAVNVEKARLGSKTQVDVLQKLGINLKDANGQWKSGATVLMEFRDKISQVGDASERAYDLSTMMGRGYAEILPWFTKSKKEIDDYTESLKSMGLILTDKDMKTWGTFMMDEKKMSMMLVALQLRVAQLVIPTLNALMPILNDIAGLFLRIPKGVLLTLAAIGGFSLAVTKGVAAWKAFSEVAGAIGAIVSKIVGRTAAEVADTAVVEANTAAVVENTAARVANGAVPGAPSLIPAGGATAAAGGAGMSSLATLGAVAAAGASIAVGAGLIYAETHYTAPSEHYGLQPMGGKGGGGGKAYEETLKANQTQVHRNVLGMQQLKAITDRMNGMKPTWQNAGAIQQFDRDINQLKRDYPALVDNANLLKTAVDKQAGAFNTAANAALALHTQMEQILTTLPKVLGVMTGNQAQAFGYVDANGNLTDFGKSTAANFNPNTNAANVQAAADAKYWRGVAKARRAKKTAKKMAAGGYVPATPGGTLTVIGEAGQGEYVVPENQMGGGNSVHIHIGTVVGTDDRAARQLSEMVGRHLSRGVMRHLVGQNV